MHEYGTTSQIVKVKLLEIEEQVEKLANELPNETIVLITADHGLIDVDPIELNNYPDFVDCLSKPFAGEGRFAQFYVKEGMQSIFEELFKVTDFCIPVCFFLVFHLLLLHKKTVIINIIHNFHYTNLAIKKNNKKVNDSV
mgnify:CR=1 FL=1